MKSKKIIQVILSFLILISITSIKVNAHQNDIFEDFEKYSEGTYPNDYFVIKYNGTGDAAQKVVKTLNRNNEETKVFRLQGKSGWASEQLYRFNETTDIITIEVNMKPVAGSFPGRISLYNESVGSWGTRISGVLFEGNKIYTLINSDDTKEQIGTYELDTWYKIKIVNNMLTRSFDVYLDGELKSTNKPMNASTTPTSINLTAGNTGSINNEIYFDDVKVDFQNVSRPRVENINVSGDPTQGETLNASYDFIGHGSNEFASQYAWYHVEQEPDKYFNSWNVGGVYSGTPSRETSFTLNSYYSLSEMNNYHWNYFGSAQDVGQIGFVHEDGTIYGPFKVTPLAGSGRPNVNWVAYFEPELILKPGTYTVTDTHKDSWAFNATSGGRGFTYLYGKKLNKIDGATNTSYTLTSQDADKKILFGITPKNDLGVQGYAYASDSSELIKGLEVPGKVGFKDTTIKTKTGELVTIELNRSEGWKGDVSVDLHLLDDMYEQLDSLKTQTITWSNQDLAPKFVEVKMLDDGNYHGIRTVKYELINATGGITLNTPSLTIEFMDNHIPNVQLKEVKREGTNIILEWEEIKDANYLLYISEIEGEFLEEAISLNAGTLRHTFTDTDLEKGYFFKLVAKLDDLTSEPSFENVNHVIVYHDIIVSETQHGHILSPKVKAEKGDIISLEINPDEGYRLKELKLNDTVLEEPRFVMPDKPALISAVFEEIEYEAKLETQGNGNIKLDVDKAKPGESVNLSVTPNKGYRLKAIRVNGTLIEGTSFVMPHEDVLISVEFEAIQYVLIKGFNQTFMLEDKQELEFVYNADLDLFAYAILDDTLLTQKQYTLESGSIILKLKNQVLNELKEGTHVLSVFLKNGSKIETKFSVTKATQETKKETLPTTGHADYTLIMAYGLVVIGLYLYLKKES